MAHISLSRNVSYVRLVEMVKEYLNLRNASTDIFEKAEYEGFINDIFDFVSLHRGINYWNKVLNEANGISVSNY